MSFRVRFIVIPAAALCTMGVAACALVYWRASMVLHEASSQAAKSGDVPLFLTRLQRSTSAFEPVLPVAGFRSAAAFDGDLFVCSSGTLFRYRNGQLQQTWFIGRDLPPAPLRLLAVRKGIAHPELWIATDGAGLILYDGAGFEQLRPQSSALRQITALLPLQNGRVLVGTAEAGLYLSDGRSLHLFHPEFAKTEVTVLAGDEDAFWVGTRKEGAWLWQGGQATHVTNALPDMDVLSIAARGDQAWVGTALGVSEFVGGKLTRHLAGGTFAQAVAEHDGKLWIGTVDQGTLQVPLESRAPRPISVETLRETEPSAVAFTAVDNRLLAIESTDIRELPTREPRVTVSEDFLTDGHVTALDADARGRLWVGTFDRGLDVLDLKHDSRNRHLEDDVLFCINRIKADSERGITAVATANGLALFNTSAALKQVLDHEHGLIANHVTDVLFRKHERNGSMNDDMIVATPAGLTIFEGSKAASLSGFQGLVSNHVYTLAEANGALYAGTLGGVSVIRGGSVEAGFNTANSQLKQNWITASASWDGNLYLGTYGSGVVQMQPDGATAAYPAFECARFEINPNAMLATHGALYAGTADHGLAILRRGANRWQFVSAGLPSTNVTALAEQDGALYIGTLNGLVRIREILLLP